VRAPDFSSAEVASYYRARLPELKQLGPEWRGVCPVHHGKDDNFAVNPENGLAFCHSQCSRGWSILQLEHELTGRDWRNCRTEVDAIIGRPERSLSKLREVATYDYTDASGKFMFQVVRYEPKTFRQRRRVVKVDDNSAQIAWEYNVRGVSRVLYHLPKVLKAEQVLLVEGEKDVGNLEQLGFVATCNAGGACVNPAKWLKNYTETLADKRVVLLPDNDEPGQKHALTVVSALRNRVKELRVVKIPAGKDASDWIAAGATRETIAQAIEEATVVGGNAIGNCESTEPSERPAPSGLVQIQVNDRPFRAICEQALNALRASNIPPRLFVRASQIVCVETTELGRPCITELNDTKLQHCLTHAADFFEATMRGGRHEVPPPLDVARDVRSRDPVSWGFPVLDAVVEAPTLRSDGTILSTPGYDPLSRLYLVPSAGLEDIEIPEEPCSDHVDVAREALRDLLADFPFVDQASYANAVGAMMTAVCRQIIGGPVPMALFDATTQGTGKTLLAEIIALLLTGRPADLISPPSDPDEWRKQLTSILIEAPPMVIIDNVTATVDWPYVAKVVTGEMHQDRILGKSKTISVPVRCSWIVTGNNLQLAGDMPRRCFWVRMDAGCAEPFRRTGFRHEPLKDWVLAHRRELLVALLTLARAWFAAGRPRSRVAPVGSFERWTEIVSGILEFGGVEGFLGNSEALFAEADSERAEWEAFLDTLEEIFYGSPFTIAELWDRMNEKTYEAMLHQAVLSDRAEQLREVIPTDLTRWSEREGQFKQRLGLALRTLRNRRFGKRQLSIERAASDTHNKVARWKVRAHAS
jgi:5S rRNA maturation endonuclease (ribonuclease M5)